MVCDILDWKCIFVNEIAGGVFLAMLLIALLFVIAATRLKIGYETTLTLGLVIMLLGGIAIAGITAILAYATVFVGIMIAWMVQKVIGNRN